MTDQGALERARALRVLKRLSGNPRTMIPMQFADDEVVVIAAAITTAASEARAAERIATIEECAQWLAPNFPGLARDMVRALATPAQSEEK